MAFVRDESNQQAGAVPKTTMTRTRFLIEYELQRYYPITLCKCIQFLLLITFPFGVSYVGEKIWPLVYETITGGDSTAAKDPRLEQYYSQTFVLLFGFSAFLLHNVFLAVLYTFKIPFFEKYKVHEGPWQWEVVSAEKWYALLKKTIALCAINGVCITHLLNYISSFVLQGDLVQTRNDIESFPSAFEMSYQLLFCMLLEDFGFHHMHLLLHTKQFYWIHKVHHSHHGTFGLAAVYAHPIEYIFGNLLPSTLGPAALTCFGKLSGASSPILHTWTLAIWGAVRVSVAVGNHSGYQFPISPIHLIPFKAPTHYHDFHHTKNIQNFSGVLRIWDYIYGTDQFYFQQQQLKLHKKQPNTNTKSQ